MNASPPMKTYSMFEILDRTFRVYRDNFLSCVILATVVMVPVTIINFILSTSSLQKLSVASNSPTPNISNADLSTVCLSFLITMALAVVQVVLTSGPISYMASESIFGRKVSLIEAFQARQMRFSVLGWGLVLFYFILGAFAFAISMIGALCAPFLGLLGAVVYVGVAIYAFLIPVLTLENVNPSLGLNRAWSLGRARFWTVVGVGLVILLLTLMISFAVTSVGGLLLAQPLKAASDLTLSAFDTVLGTIANIFLLPLMPIAMTLLYYDTRLRVEGLESALQSTDKLDARPWDIASPLPQRGLAPNDWRNLAIIMVVTVLGVVLLGTYLAPVIDKLMPGLPAM